MDWRNCVEVSGDRLFPLWSRASLSTFAVILLLWILSCANRGVEFSFGEDAPPDGKTHTWGFYSYGGTFSVWWRTHTNYWLKNWGRPQLVHANDGWATPRIPYWPFAIITGILPLAHARGVERRRFIAEFRRNRGLCPVCAYDLRATPDRCPECGTEIEVAIQLMIRMSNRPLSVTLVAWLFILAGVVGIAYHVREIDLQHPFGHGVLLACAVRLLAIVGGAFALRGHNWARWLMLAWIVYHVVLSAFHSPVELIMHAAIATIVAFVLFRPKASMYFRAIERADLPVSLPEAGTPPPSCSRAEPTASTESP